MAYQLLRGLRDLHAAGVVHGHLTPDNVLLTSWGWVLISDVGVSRYKPATLPDDDPGTYVHWYEGRGRDAHGDGEDDGEEWDEEEDGGGGGAGRHRGKGEERCCLAPERFEDGYDAAGTRPAPGTGGKLEDEGGRPAHDGTRPQGQAGAGEYLDRLSESSGAGDGTGGGGDGTASDPSSSDGTAGAAPFPDCLPRTVHPFLLRLRTEVHGPDARIALVACHYGRIMGEAAGVHDGEGVAQFRRLVGPELLGHELPADEDGEGERGRGVIGGG
ncbi:hypothetical protein THAOC_18830 [Thalassiosira oceanica]|uniref:Protein kinase domain-containing protein n=1 Tax=Thalassiosira oceanica TaxID=159749 RepID=K0S784_THAOC|nr:hypothetical protein THAOC_18830 [Thalassiosira oceanica]|eukprot:EJK60764.1 hypothetical protein THAOC_18830 [Thalassiosira oceanica]